MYFSATTPSTRKILQQELYRQKRAPNNDRQQQDPFWDDQRLELLHLETVSVEHDDAAVIGHHQRNKESADIRRLLEALRGLFRQRDQQQVDADVAPLPQNPWRSKKRSTVHGIFRDFDHPRQRADAEVPAEDIDADQNNNRTEYQAERDTEGLHDRIEATNNEPERRHRRPGCCAPVDGPRRRGRIERSLKRSGQKLPKTLPVLRRRLHHFFPGRVICRLDVKFAVLTGESNHLDVRVDL